MLLGLGLLELWLVVLEEGTGGLNSSPATSALKLRPSLYQASASLELEDLPMQISGPHVEFVTQ